MKGTLTAAQRALVRQMRDQHGIDEQTTRHRILRGWPEGRLHEQPIRDASRCAKTRRYTPACRPKPNHAWRRWVGAPGQARSNLKGSD